MSFQLLVNYLFVSYFVKNSHSNLRFVKLKPKYRHYHPHLKLFQKHLPPLAVPLDVLRKGLCFMYLQIFRFFMGEKWSGCFSLELVRPPHVGNPPVVVVSEVVADASPLIHQIVRPLPSAEVPQEGRFYFYHSIIESKWSNLIGWDTLRYGALIG